MKLLTQFRVLNSISISNLIWLIAMSLAITISCNNEKEKINDTTLPLLESEITYQEKSTPKIIILDPFLLLALQKDLLTT